MYRRFRTSLRLGAVLGSSLPLFALAAPDSGQILNQQKTQPQLPKHLPAAEPGNDPAHPQSGGPSVRVDTIRFTQLEGLASDAELQSIVVGSLGQTLSYEQLLSLTDSVTAYLRKKGFLLARAYLPKQEIADGELQISLLSGASDDIPTVELAENARIRADFVSKLSLRGATPGEPLKTEELERAVLLVNDLPNISAQSILERGSRPGSTQVILKVEEDQILNGIFTLDTFGNRHTGILQGNGQVAFNNLSGYGDRLAIGIGGSEGLRRGDISYSSPLGFDGLSASISYSGLTYELGDAYKDLAIEGLAHSFSASVTYPTIRTRALSLWQGAQIGYRQLEDDVSGEELRDREIKTVATDFTLHRYDRFAGGGLTTAYTKVLFGDLTLGVPFDKTADAATAGTAGSYAKLVYNATRLQRISENDTLFLSINGQIADGNLDSSEKFILGGPYGVRAYPVGEASGDQGLTLTAEWRHDLASDVFGSRLQFVSFYDSGYIQLHKNPWSNSINTATGDNHYSISGAGFGLNFGKSDKFMIRGSVARTIGKNAGRDLSGNDADNRDDDTRIWLQTLFWF